MLLHRGISQTKSFEGDNMKNQIELLLTNGLLIDGIGEKNQEKCSIGINDGRILFISNETDQMNEIHAANVYDIEGYALLPGIINAHVHAGFKYVNGLPLGDFHDDYLKACLKEGVTTIRDEGMFTDDAIETVIAKRNQLKIRNDVPRIITTGKFLSAPKGYGGKDPIALSNVNDVRIQVNRVLDQGIDMIKTVLEDGLDPSTFGLPKLTDELLSSICECAHDRNTKVSAHVTQTHNLKRLVQAGIDDAAHMVYDFLPDDLIDQMIESNVYVVPTLTVLKMFQEKFGVPLLHQGQENVRRFAEKGGKIALGDDFVEEDTPWYRMGMPYLEFQLLKDSGLTETQIITAATKHGAEVCNVSDEIGTIEIGKIADILIVKGNPQTNLDDIKNVALVIKNGKIAHNYL